MWDYKCLEVSNCKTVYFCSSLLFIMEWEETALEVLKSKFNNGIFRAKEDELDNLLVDLKNLIKDLIENVQLYPVCDTCFKGRREVGKPKKYELKEEKDKIAYF